MRCGAARARVCVCVCVCVCVKEHMESNVYARVVLRQTETLGWGSGARGGEMNAGRGWGLQVGRVEGAAHASAISGQLPTMTLVLSSISSYSSRRSLACISCIFSFTCNASGGQADRHVCMTWHLWGVRGMFGGARDGTTAACSHNWMPQGQGVFRRVLQYRMWRRSTAFRPHHPTSQRHAGWLACVRSRHVSACRNLRLLCMCWSSPRPTWGPLPALPTPQRNARPP